MKNTIKEKDFLRPLASARRQRMNKKRRFVIPPTSPQQQVTQLLCDWRNGDEKALEKLIPLIQPELHRLAHAYMSRERAGHTLQTTALLDDAYMQLPEEWVCPGKTAPIFLRSLRSSCAGSWFTTRENGAHKNAAAGRL